MGWGEPDPRGLGGVGRGDLEGGRAWGGSLGGTEGFWGV